MPIARTARKLVTATLIGAALTLTSAALAPDALAAPHGSSSAGSGDSSGRHGTTGAGPGRPGHVHTEDSAHRGPTRLPDREGTDEHANPNSDRGPHQCRYSEHC